MKTSNLIFIFAFIGFYRVNYDENNWALLISYLKSDNYAKIHPVNRAQLLDDSLNLARAGVLPYGTALKLAEYLVKELDYIPWYSALTAFSFLNLRLTGTTIHPLFKVKQLDWLIHFIIFIIFLTTLTLIPLTWRIWWAPNNASKWQIGFNSAFKGLMILKKELKLLTYEVGCLKHVYSHHDLRFCHGNNAERRSTIGYSHKQIEQKIGTGSPEQ